MKLRAYDTIEKRYVPIQSIQFDHLGNGEPFTLTTGGKTWVISKFILEPWTGLRDKNGREIWEGDILSSGEAFSHCVVKFGNFPADDGAIIENISGYYVENIGTKNVRTLRDWGIIRYECIGNIHENPELLSLNRPDSRLSSSQ